MIYPLGQFEQTVDKTLLKKGYSILKKNELIFSSKLKHNYYKFTFKTKGNNLLNIEVDNILEKVKKRGYEWEQYELAGVLHLLKFQEELPQAKPKQNDNKIPNSNNVGASKINSPAASIRIDILADELNLTTAWETAKVQVKILLGKKEYNGNLETLNAVRYDEGRMGSFTLTDFSSQDRQIIKYISSNADQEGRFYSIDATVMSDLLHICCSSDKIYIGKNSISSRIGETKIVALKNNSEKLLSPAIYINKSMYPINGNRYVVGVNGLWLEVNGEYSWVPGTFDLNWIRHFLNGKPIELSESNIGNFPLQVIEHNDYNLKQEECFSHYNITIEDSELEAELLYKYKDIKLSISEQKIHKDNKDTFLRDKIKERNLFKELQKIGFSFNTDTLKFTLSDSEQIGMFLDYYLSKWVNTRSVSMSYKVALMLSNLNELQIYISNIEDSSNQCKVDYKISNSSNSTISWTKLAKDLTLNREYIQLSDDFVGKSTPKLIRFVNTFNSVVKKSPTQLQFPKSSIINFTQLGKDIIHGIPDNWINNEQDKMVESIIKSIDITKNFKGQLKDYQVTSVTWMYKMLLQGLNPMLADEMGLGKTIQALALINLLKNNKFTSTPTLIVSPTSLIDNWLLETKKFTPKLKVKAIHGPNRSRQFNSIEKCDVIITSYALLQKDIEKYLECEIGFIILDEAQYIKNPSTINAKTAKLIPCKNRLVLTGTPLENKVDDIWSIFDFLNPGMLGNRDNFKAIYSDVNNNVSLQRDLSNRIAPFLIRRQKDVVITLPNKKEKIVYVDLSREQEDLYQEQLIAGRDKLSQMINGKATRFDVLSSLTRLRQICCHPSILPEDMSNGITSSSKLDAVKEMVYESIESGKKMLIFSQFTSILSLLKEWLEKEKISFAYLDGTSKKRQDIVDDFNNSSKNKVFLLSLKAGGTGLNITSATNVIIFDPWWNPTSEQQAIDRVHRIGQEEEVFAYKLITRGTIEEKILNMQKKKKGLFENVVENVSDNKFITDEDLEMLLTSEL